MIVSKVYDSIAEYNPISLSLEGVTFLLKKDNLQMRTGAVFFSMLPTILAYFASRFAAAALPAFLAVLSPLECAGLTLAVASLAMSVGFGLISKGRPQPVAS